MTYNVLINLELQLPPNPTHPPPFPFQVTPLAFELLMVFKCPFQASVAIIAFFVKGQTATQTFYISTSNLIHLLAKVKLFYLKTPPY